MVWSYTKQCCCDRAVGDVVVTRLLTASTSLRWASTSPSWQSVTAVSRNLTRSWPQRKTNHRHSWTSSKKRYVQLAPSADSRGSSIRVIKLNPAKLCYICFSVSVIMNIYRTWNVGDILCGISTCPSCIVSVSFTWLCKLNGALNWTSSKETTYLIYL